MMKIAIPDASCGQNRPLRLCEAEVASALLILREERPG
jgi:hypothetical protein